MLWLTDITEHPTKRGQGLLLRVLDAFSRRVVGWSIDRRCETALVNDAWSWRASHARQDLVRSSTRTTAARPDSIGRRNTLTLEVMMGRPAGWMKELTGRSAMKSPGAPALRREIERDFWRAIATGITAEEAAAIVGRVTGAGARWFRQGGGMPLSISHHLRVATCRSLNAKRSLYIEPRVWRPRDRPTDRSRPSTVSREFVETQQPAAAGSNTEHRWRMEGRPGGSSAEGRQARRQRATA